MILLDADVLLLDIRYRADSKFASNRRLLDVFVAEQLEVGITVQALLEVVGILSFNVSPTAVLRLPDQLQIQYSLSVIPPINDDSDYVRCSIGDLVAQMSRRMALGDAVQAVQINTHGSGIECLLTWNAKHFVGRLSIPVLTPQEWLDQRNASATSTNP
jgi:hypothetical protein